LLCEVYKKKGGFFRMKKIVMGIAAVAMAASIFAVDFTSQVKVKGDIAGVTIDNSGDKAVTTFNLLGVEDTNQKDNDLLQVAFTGDKAGATFKFWTAASESAVTMRGLSVWFQPIEQLKITTGGVGLSLYTERLNWWKVPCGSSLAQFKGWDHRWSSAAGLRDDQGGIMAELTIDALYVGAGVAPGYGNWFFTKAGEADATNASYGAVVKYQIADAISAGIAWRDDGKAQPKILSAGVEFGNYGTEYYGFLQPKLYFDISSAAWSHSGDVKLAGLVIDNYISYNLGFMKLEATIPVTIRGFLDADDATDVSYMTARIKGTIPMDALSLYFVVGSNEGLNNGPATTTGGNPNLAWVLNDTFMDNFNLYGNVGVSFNIGTCALDLGLEVAYDNAVKETVIAVPFVTSISF
jgi:hypothetical protein